MDNLITANIRQRPVRTLVSVTGIALGVCLVMLFTGLATGMSKDLQRRSSNLRAEIIFTRPGSMTMLTASANHYERQFAVPEYLDIHLKIDRHVGFAFGRHLCLGASLARLEARIAFEELLARYPEYELSEPIVRYYAGNVRGLSNLPIRATATAPVLG